MAIHILTELVTLQDGSHMHTLDSQALRHVSSRARMPHAWPEVGMPPHRARQWELSLQARSWGTQIGPLARIDR